MQKWIVKFNSPKTIEILEEMDIISYKPFLYRELKHVFIETDMPESEILKIEGVQSCKKNRIGTVNV